MGKKTIAKNGRSVQVHYKGSFDDGTIFDNSYERGQTIGFTVGEGEMIPGFDEAVNGMKVGETKNVKITSNDAYGEHDPEGVQEIDKNQFPNDFEFESGVVVEGTVGDRAIRGVISGINDATVTIDFNHPMAGKDLNFQIELVDVN